MLILWPLVGRCGEAVEVQRRPHEKNLNLILNFAVILLLTTRDKQHKRKIFCNHINDIFQMLFSGGVAKGLEIVETAEEMDV